MGPSDALPHSRIYVRYNFVWRRASYLIESSLCPFVSEYDSNYMSSALQKKSDGYSVWAIFTWREVLGREE